MKKRNTLTSDSEAHTSDFLLIFYNQQNGDYRIQLDESLPSFGLHTGDIICGSVRKPQRHDLIVCSLPNESRGLIFGKFVARQGRRILIETSMGRAALFAAQSLVVIDSIL